MNLTIVSNLIDSCKSDSLCIRYVTMHSKCDLNFYNLIEVEQELKDPYFKYMKELGLMDYVDDLITPEEIELKFFMILRFPIVLITQKGAHPSKAD